MEWAPAIGFRLQQLEGRWHSWHHMHVDSISVIILTARGGRQKFCNADLSITVIFDFCLKTEAVNPELYFPNDLTTKIK